MHRLICTKFNLKECCHSDLQNPACKVEWCLLNVKVDLEYYFHLYRVHDYIQHFWLAATSSTFKLPSLSFLGLNRTTLVM